MAKPTLKRQDRELKNTINVLRKEVIELRKENESLTKELTQSHNGEVNCDSVDSAFPLDVSLDEATCEKSREYFVLCYNEMGERCADLFFNKYNTLTCINYKDKPLGKITKTVKVYYMISN